MKEIIISREKYLRTKKLFKNLRNRMVTRIFVTTWLLIMETRRDVFQAIADPTRRAILGLLALQSLTLNSLADNFDVSRPAISRHVKILNECGLVEIKQDGRERYCEAKLDKLEEVQEWIEQYKQFWESKLDALESYLDKLQKEKYGKQKGKKRR